MPRLVLLLMVAGLVSGCTHTHSLTLSSLEGRAAVTERAAGGGDAVVRLDGEPPRLADDLVLDADSARWTDRLSGRVRAETLARVCYVAFRRDGHGALTGAAIGAGMGFVLDATDDTTSPSARDRWRASGIAGAGLLGALVGFVRSDRIVYRR